MCLIRREWIDFGHKFGDRTGVRNADPNERSPVFLQWLDCVHQLQHQFPAAFQFTRSFLVSHAIVLDASIGMWLRAEEVFRG